LRLAGKNNNQIQQTLQCTFLYYTTIYIYCKFSCSSVTLIPSRPRVARSHPALTCGACFHPLLLSAPIPSPRATQVPPASFSSERRLLSSPCLGRQIASSLLSAMRARFIRAASSDARALSIPLPLAPTLPPSRVVFWISTG
jgi:hypothetical protein